MYIYVLQTINGKIDDEDVFTVKKNIEKYHFSSYRIKSDLKNIPYLSLDLKNNTYIPIGSLEFVSTWLKIYDNIDYLKPIEIPDLLKEEEFLQREYYVCNKNVVVSLKNILSSDEKKEIITPYSILRKNIFIKNISKLKSFSYIGNLLNLNVDQIPDGNYAISEYINILSEYRVFVDKMNIKAIQFYDGDCKIFPNVNTIQKMINKYYTDKNKPDSYTLDIAVINKNNTLYTVILEIHPVCSVGLYGYSDSHLLKMYVDGIKWYKNQK